MFLKLRSIEYFSWKDCKNIRICSAFRYWISVRRTSNIHRKVVKVRSINCRNSNKDISERRLENIRIPEISAEKSSAVLRYWAFMKRAVLTSWHSHRAIIARSRQRYLNYACIGYNARDTAFKLWTVTYTPDPPPFVTHRDVTCQKCLLISVMSNA